MIVVPSRGRLIDVVLVCFSQVRRVNDKPEGEPCLLMVKVSIKRNETELYAVGWKAFSNANNIRIIYFCSNSAVLFCYWIYKSIGKCHSAINIFMFKNKLMVLHVGCQLKNMYRTGASRNMRKLWAEIWDMFTWVKWEEMWASSIYKQTKYISSKWMSDSYAYWDDLRQSSHASVAGVAELSAYIFSTNNENIVRVSLCNTATEAQPT